MNHKYTTIILDQNTDSFSFHDYISRDEAIKRYREMAARDKIEAEAILNAKDEDFEITQHTGLHIWRNKVKI